MLLLSLWCIALVTVVVSSDCPPCTPSQCSIAACSSVDVFLCAAGPAYKGCSPNPWSNPVVCTECCDYSSCFLTCSGTCTESECTYCAAYQNFCTAGQAAGQCGNTDTWSVADGCTSCCSISSCSAPQTPAPTAPPTPPPSGLNCSVGCTPTDCATFWCSPDSPYVCVVGEANGDCESDPSNFGGACQTCCDTDTCSGTPAPPATPVPTPPSTPSPAVTPAPTATLAPTPAPTQAPTPAPTPPATSAAPVAPTTGVPSTSVPATTAAPPGTCPPCSRGYCQRSVVCAPAAPYQCMAGKSIDGCSPRPWDSSQCTDCCDTSVCPSYTTIAPASTATPPPGPTSVPTNPPTPRKLTPAPGWTNNPSPFPPPTPLPPQPSTTPVPSGGCPMCEPAQCDDPNLKCSLAAPFVCLTGTAPGGCQPTPWTEAGGCSSCCDYASCLPPAPTPFPATPWDSVPPSTNNCTLNGTIALAPSSAATPYGGIDVSEYGCKVGVSQDCCGITPRFNWILSTCNPDASKRLSMACNHTSGNTSRADIYYINAYQWNAESNYWVLDPSSSVRGDAPGETIDFLKMNMTLTDNGYKQDWDLKFGPTTNAQHTDGLGPPAMMFVISARQFTWSAFYLLNQITLNRGPGAEHYADNCWSSSAGELDLIEPPFWAGIDLPADRLYLTITANAGRCFPVEKKVSSRFQKECNTPICCEACACPPGEVCFGNPNYAGYENMGCVKEGGTIPEGLTAFEVDGDPTACGAYFGGVSGGADSTAYFSNGLKSPRRKQGDAKASLISADTDVTYVAVVDADGVTVFRWSTADTSTSDAIWPGLRKFDADDVLPRNPAVAIAPNPPCDDPSVPCSIYEPSCDDECVIMSASGVFGIDQMSGPYAAESARDGLNWWNLFVSTNQTPNMISSQLPMYVDVPVHPIPLPFNCSGYCGLKICREATRCPVTSPYMCTAGDGINGCNNVTTFWPLSPHCTACCDVKLCEYDCSAQCSPAQCDAQNCETGDYYCSSGPLKGGCNPSPSFFPDLAQCYSCCDNSNCHGPK